jgi:hypothetical protein
MVFLNLLHIHNRMSHIMVIFASQASLYQDKNIKRKKLNSNANIYFHQQFQFQFYLASIIATGVTLGQVKLHILCNIKHSIKLYYMIPYKNLKKY